MIEAYSAGMALHAMILAANRNRGERPAAFHVSKAQADFFKTLEERNMNPITKEVGLFESAAAANAAGHTVPITTTAPPDEPLTAAANRKRRRRMAKSMGAGKPKFLPEQHEAMQANKEAAKKKAKAKREATANMKKRARAKAR